MKKIRNLMEEIVFEAMDEILEEISVCSCETCYSDIAAKALNDLEPKYFVTEKGKLYSKMQALKTQTEVDVVSAVTKAAVLIKRHPRH